MKNTTKKQDGLQPMIEELGHSSLGKIIQKAKWLLALDRFVQTILPVEFAKQCRVMNVDKGVLILGVNSAAIAMRIRFMASDLIKILNKNSEFKLICDVQCKVNHATTGASKA